MKRKGEMFGVEKGFYDEHYTSDFLRFVERGDS